MIIMANLMFILTFLVLFSITEIFGMTRQQLKNTLKMFKKNCMAQNHVTEEQIGRIEQGEFVNDPDVKCYIACVYKMSQIIKNNKLNHLASMKQIDVMYPPEVKEPAKAAAIACQHIGREVKEICEASFAAAKCVYEYDPKNFIFP